MKLRTASYALVLAAGLAAVSLSARLVAAAPTSPVLDPRVAAIPVAPIAAASLKLRSIQVPPALASQLTSKAAFDPAKLRSALTYLPGDVPVLTLRSGAQFQLEKPGAEVPPPAATALPATLVTSLKKYQGYIGQAFYGPAKLIGAGAVAVLNSINDHTSVQTAIRNQGPRGTCVAHASVAALEALYKRGGTTKDLSENHAYNIFMQNVGSTCMVDPGLATYQSAGFLSTNRICEESQSPYVNNTGAACATIPAACASNKRHGFVATYTFYSPAFGGAGTYVANNTNYLEALLHEGRDVVMGLYVAGNDWSDGTTESGTIDVQMSGGNPAEAYAGHAMLLVGYNQAQNYFIFKNSWGPERGHAGYLHISYEYVQTYAKYGYVVLAATTP